MTLNNPLVLANITVLGVGMEIRLAKHDEKWHVCIEVAALVWKTCLEWGGK